MVAGSLDEDLESVMPSVLTREATIRHPMHVDVGDVCAVDEGDAPAIQEEVSGKSSIEHRQVPDDEEHPQSYGKAESVVQRTLFVEGLPQTSKPLQLCESGEEVCLEACSKWGFFGLCFQGKSPATASCDVAFALAPRARERGAPVGVTMKQVWVHGASTHEPCTHDVVDPIPSSLVWDSRSTSLAGSSEESKMLRLLQLTGFKHAGVNGLFLEAKPEANLAVGGRETYWAVTGNFFMFYNVATRTWAVERSKHIADVQAARRSGFLHSQEDFDVRGPPALEGWREWDRHTRAWLPCPRAGIATRGRARPSVATRPPTASSAGFSSETLSERTVGSRPGVLPT